MTEVQQAVAEYLAHGWKLCRINPGAKAPRYEQWNAPGHEIRTPEAFPVGWGVGLLHAYSGTCCLDVDSIEYGEPYLTEHKVSLSELLDDPFSVRLLSGRPDRLKLLYALPEPRVTVQFAPYTRDGKEHKALELRCSSATGNSVQDVLPPSIHPDLGTPYRWEFGAFGHWQALPSLPAALAALWDDLRAPVPTTAAPLPSGAPPARLAAWLAEQDPSAPYPDWLLVGQKLHVEYQGSMEGFAVWQRWSSGSPKWDDKARAEMLPKWKGFRLSGPAIATLAAEVRQMPAAAEEFTPVAAPEPSPQGNPALAATPAAVGDLILQETEAQRQNRELIEPRLVYLAAARHKYWLRDDHDAPRIDRIDSLNGAMDADAVRQTFTPYMVAEPVGKAMAVPDPVQYFREKKWARVVRQLGFHPGAGRFYTEADGSPYLNSYRGKPPELLAPPPDIVENFYWLLERIRDKEFRAWLLNFYAHAVQRPGVKIATAPLLFGKPGSGKSTLLETLPRLLFSDRYISAIEHDQLTGRFTSSMLADSWWICLRELRMTADHKLDRAYIAEKLKPWITEPTITVEYKGQTPYQIANRIQITATSNFADALHIEDAETERRWAIAELPDPLSPEDIRRRIVPTYASEHSARWFWTFFKQWEIDPAFSAQGRPPKTLAKAAMAEQSLGTWESRIQERMWEGHPPFDKDVVAAGDVQDAIRGLGHPNWAKVGTIMKGAPFNAIEARTDTARYYAWRNVDLWGKLPATCWRDYLNCGIRPNPQWPWNQGDLVGEIDASAS